MAVNIKLKHSSVDGKAPVAADLENGELALNINENSPAAYIKDSNGDIVQLAGAGSVTDEASVKKAGDNMTGDLTIGPVGGPSNIRISNGPLGTHGGGFYVGDEASGVESYLDGSGRIVSHNNNAEILLTDGGSGTTYLNATSDGLAIGGQVTPSGPDANATIYMDAATGAAEFAGNVNIGDVNGSNTIGNGTLLFADGGVFFQRSALAAATDAVLTQIHGGSSNDRVFETTVDGTTYIGGSPNNSGRPANITLAADGAGTFAGNVVSGAVPDDSSSTNNGTSLNQGRIFTQVPAGEAAGTEVYGQYYGTENAVSLKANGSGEFASNISVGAYRPFTFTPTGEGVGLFNNGTMNIVCYNSGNERNVFEVYNTTGTDSSPATAPTIALNNSGKAEFADYVMSGDLNGAHAALSGLSGEVAYWDGSKYPWRIYGNGSAIFSGDVQAAYYTAIQDSANSAVFRGTYTGSSLTYSSVIYGDGSAVFGSGVLCNSSSVTGMIAGNFNGNDANMAYPCIRARQYAAGGRAYQGMNAAGTETYYVGGSGEAGFAGTVTATVVPPSDARFKENITPAKPQLADVVALGGLLKNYDWNDQAPLNEEIRSQRQLGLIAQEAAEVCPAIVKDIHRTKQGAVITPEEIIPAVYEEKVIPAEYKTIVVPAKLGPKGKEIVPASTEEVLVTPEYTEQVLVEEEKVIPATYEELDDSYKGISTDALIMKLIGAVAELSAEVTALKAAKVTRPAKK
jgi:hypothetical protein